MLRKEDLPCFANCPCGLDGLRALNDKLNAKVVEQINTSQELLMLNTFGHETNEYIIKECFQERMAEVSAWRWVLEDLKNRLEDAINILRYEHNALRVVIDRLKNEINNFSKEGSRPGALCPLSDNVEETIHQEHKYLRGQKKDFENMILALEEEIKRVEKTRKRIETDIFNKNKAIEVDEFCSRLDKTGHEMDRSKKKKRCTPITRWENRCASLKRAGLRALHDAFVTRQQVRGARIHLSISAQSHAARVDCALRRRLQANRVRLQELSWQKDEAVKDLLALNEEQISVEKSILETMEQERLIEEKLVDRTQKPPKELTKDEVQRRLKDELARIRNFLKYLRKNLERILSLQKNLVGAINKIDCYAEDILKIVCLDEERIKARTGEELHMGASTTEPAQTEIPSAMIPVSPAVRTLPVNITPPAGPLTVIKEEEEDDYPFDD